MDFIKNTRSTPFNVRLGLVLTIGLVFYGLCNCNEAPLEPRKNEWREVAAFPSESAAGIAEGKGGVIWAGDSSKPVIYRYAGGVMEEAFKGPYSGGDFLDVNCSPNYVWAAGCKELGLGSTLPYLVKYDGNKWEEIVIPDIFNETSLHTVSPVADDFCWVAGARGVYAYDKGVWRKTLSTDIRGRFYITVAPRGSAFVYQEITGAEPNASILVSDDRGASWATEKIETENPHFILGSTKPSGLATQGDRLCWGALLRVAGSRKRQSAAYYYAVLVRDDAPPGKGSYEIVFMAPRGPYLADIQDIVFRDEANGYVVGSETSVALKDGEWIMESFPDSWKAYFVAVAAGVSSYWATVSSYGPGPTRLYSAP